MILYTSELNDCIYWGLLGNDGFICLYVFISVFSIFLSSVFCIKSTKMEMKLKYGNICRN